MRLLLDTHVLLWAVAGSPLLTQEAHRLIEATDEVQVSAASIWEVTKHRDPFERRQAAQAMAERLGLVTAEEVLANYSGLALLV